VASLFGPKPVLRLVGSTWFLAGAGLMALAGLLTAVLAIGHRNWPSVIQHIGLVVALVGVGVNQTAARNGYLFLEQGAGVSNVCLSSDLRRVEELPEPVSLDSITTTASKAFRLAPVAWVSDSTGSRSRPVTYNKPLTSVGRQLLLSQLAEPGFLTEYEVHASAGQYLLLHNQVSEPEPDLRIQSFAYDAAAKKVGLMVGKERHWLGIGESAVVGGGMLRLVSATFAANAGAVFVINDVRYRLIVFIGFGLTLLGLLPPLFRRKRC
jgi:type IV secretory pathway TrbD component